nr:hypothetical protein CFP56_55700 [Quercus suber]
MLCRSYIVMLTREVKCLSRSRWRRRDVEDAGCTSIRTFTLVYLNPHIMPLLRKSSRHSWIDGCWNRFLAAM